MYVSKDEDEWEEDRRLLREENSAYACVVVLDDDFHEIGLVKLAMSGGGILRIR